MDKLPDELLFLIFNYIEIDKLIIKFKLISKRFYNLINELKFKTLYLKNGQGMNCWYLSYKPIKLREIIYCSKLDFLDNSSFKNNFIRLENLKINLEFNDFNLELLNQYNRLETLEINNIINLDRPIYLDLPNLRLIKIAFLGNKLKINSNRLEIIKINQSQLCEIVKPNFVKVIEIERFDECLEKFKNLCVFKCNSMDLEEYDLLLTLPSSLKELHFYFYDNLDNYMAEIITPILKHKSILKNLENVNFYFRGIELNENKSTSYYCFEDENDLSLALSTKNFYQFYGSLPWITKVNYAELMQVFDQQQILGNKSLFFRKFNNIQDVNLNIIVDEEHFILFLKNCHNLQKLSLNNPHFTQPFFNELPFIVPLLEIFNLFEEEDEIYKLDFKFILKFKLITILNATYEMSRNLVFKILQRSKFIREIGFKINNESIFLKKVSKKSFKLEIDNRVWKDLELDQIDNLIKKIELKLYEKDEFPLPNKRIKLI